MNSHHSNSYRNNRRISCYHSLRSHHNNNNTDIPKTVIHPYEMFLPNTPQWHEAYNIYHRHNPVVAETRPAIVGTHFHTDRETFKNHAYFSLATPANFEARNLARPAMANARIPHQGFASGTGQSRVPANPRNNNATTAIMSGNELNHRRNVVNDSLSTRQQQQPKGAPTSDEDSQDDSEDETDDLDVAAPENPEPENPPIGDRHPKAHDSFPSPQPQQAARVRGQVQVKVVRGKKGQIQGKGKPSHDVHVQVNSQVDVQVQTQVDVQVQVQAQVQIQAQNRDQDPDETECRRRASENPPSEPEKHHHHQQQQQHQQHCSTCGHDQPASQFLGPSGKKCRRCRENYQRLRDQRRSSGQCPRVGHPGKVPGRPCKLCQRLARERERRKAAAATDSNPNQ